MSAQRHASRSRTGELADDTKLAHAAATTTDQVSHFFIGDEETKKERKRPKAPKHDNEGRRYSDGRRSSLHLQIAEEIQDDERRRKKLRKKQVRRAAEPEAETDGWDIPAPSWTVVAIAAVVQPILVAAWLTFPRRDLENVLGLNFTQPPRKQPAPLVEWGENGPECLRTFYVVGKRPVKLRKEDSTDSPVVSSLRPGSRVQRLAPCVVNDRGLIRMRVAAYSQDTYSELWFAFDHPMVSICPDAMQTSQFQVCIQGWTTLTAEYVEGPRFFEPEPD